MRGRMHVRPQLIVSPRDLERALVRALLLPPPSDLHCIVLAPDLLPPAGTRDPPLGV